uniref:Uncharacterized protein n=1 Tax=Arundo donax TaxID=35708 RepID=A0A0A9HKM2_ARUDO
MELLNQLDGFDELGKVNSINQISRYLNLFCMSKRYVV